MFIWKSRDLRSEEIARPSPLLEFIAGEFAATVAAIWPHPHTPFLSAPSARRHLFCLALTAGDGAEPVAPDDIMERSLKSAIAIALPAPPDGLARALDRLGERAWSAQDYRGLLRILAHRKACKLVRHCDQIPVDQIRSLSRLPDLLLDGRLGELKLDEGAAELLSRLLAQLAARDGEAVATAAATRWAAFDDIDKLVEQVEADLEPEPPAPPFAATGRLRPLATKAALSDAAARYRNCLKTHHLRHAAEGTSAYYEWDGPPGVVVQITRDGLFGWTLEQARLAGNKAAPEPARSELAADLRAMGVRVGPTFGDFKRALWGLTYTPPERIRSDEDMVKELFGD